MKKLVLLALALLVPFASTHAADAHHTKAKPAAHATVHKAVAKKAAKPAAKAEKGKAYISQKDANVEPAAGPVSGSVVSATAAHPMAAYVIHPATGTVLVDENGEARMGPASLTKLMTLYLTFDALKTNRINLQTMVPVSERAWRTEGSKMFIEVGKQVDVDDLIKGISIVSGNDACIAVAEYLGGTEEGFVQAMNAKAKDLGMENTHFMNANGLPDPNQYSTAHDIALLLTAILRDFPQYKHYLAEEDFTFNNIHQQNRNGLLHTDLGIDVGKTGHTEESGFHLASSAVENGERLVVVVMGRDSFSGREGDSMKYYRQFFATYATRTMFKPGDVVVADVPVWHGTQPTVALTVAEPMAAYVNKAEQGELKAAIKYNTPLVAPMAADKPVGEISVKMPSGQTLTTALVPANAVNEGSFFARYWQSLKSKL